MPFFQNPFTSDFEGYWVLGDRQASLTFKCPRNAGRGAESVTAWVQGPYNLSGNDADGNPTNVLSLNFSLSISPIGAFINWTAVPVTITGAIQSAVLPSEVVGSLNNNTLFADWFTASLQTFQKNCTTGDPSNDRIVITQNHPQTRMRFYVSVGAADSVIMFNKLIGVAALPLYFQRHVIGYYPQLPDSQNFLIMLDTTGVQGNVINNACDPYCKSLGYSKSNVPTDFDLLRGRSGLFMVTNNSTAGVSIVYQAGAGVGDMAKKIITSGTSTIETPYVLQSGDILPSP